MNTNVKLFSVKYFKVISTPHRKDFSHLSLFLNCVMCLLDTLTFNFFVYDGYRSTIIEVTGNPSLVGLISPHFILPLLYSVFYFVSLFA